MDSDGFDAWVRNRLHPESSDIPEIISHIDPNLFEADFPMPQSADDILWWLNPNTDLSMDPATYLDPLLAAPTAATVDMPPAEQQGAGQGPLQHPAVPQQQFSAWQLAYLQQAAQQQPANSQFDLKAEQQPQPSMYPAGTVYPMPAQLHAGSAAAPDSLAFLQQLDPNTAIYSWHPSLDAPLAAGAAYAAGDAGAGAALQHAGSSGSLGRRTSPNSSSNDKPQHSRRAPISKAAAGAPAATGTGRKPRKVTDAQRAAHKRFRMRRKEKVSSLVAEVAAKQAQLQALETEREALTAKARALDQLVASAGDNVVLMQHMESLSLGPPDKDQQQPKYSSSTNATCSSGNSGSVLSLLPSASLDTNAGSAQGDCAGQVNWEGSKGEPSTDALKQTGSTAAAGAAVPAASLPTAGSTADAAAVAAAALAGNTNQPGSPSAAATASLERLEAVVRSALGRPLPRFESQQQQLRLQQFEQSQLQRRLPGPCAGGQLQGTLPCLQQLMKSLIAEITQLVLQVNKGPEQLDLGGGLGGGFSMGSSAAAEGAGAAAGGLAAQQKSAAAQRLEHIRAQVYGEFRAFAYTNRLSMCLLYSLNLETGQLALPPVDHWKSGAQLLMQRMDQQVLQDMVVAHRLYQSALDKVVQQRNTLLMQLQGALSENTGGVSARYNRDMLYPDTCSTQCLLTHVSTLTLLNAIDSNLRKEYVMDGVLHWSLNKLLPLMLSAELTVTSYPYLTDMHAIVEELVQLMPPQPDLAAATLAVQKQQQLMLEAADAEQQEPQQLDTSGAAFVQQYHQVQVQPPGAALLSNQYNQQYNQQYIQQYGPQYGQQYGQPYGQQYSQLQYQGSAPQQQQQLGYATSRQVSTGLLSGTGSYPVGAPFLSMPCS